MLNIYFRNFPGDTLWSPLRERANSSRTYPQHGLHKRPPLFVPPMSNTNRHPTIRSGHRAPGQRWKEHCTTMHFAAQPVNISSFQFSRIQNVKKLWRNTIVIVEKSATFFDPPCSYIAYVVSYCVLLSNRTYNWKHNGLNWIKIKLTVSKTCLYVKQSNNSPVDGSRRFLSVVW